MKIYKVIPIFVPCPKPETEDIHIFMKVENDVIQSIGCFESSPGPDYIGHGILFISTEVEPIKAGDIVVNLNKTKTGDSVTLVEKDLSDLEANMFYHSGNRKVIDSSRDHQPGDFFYWSLHQWLLDKDKGHFNNEPFDYLPGVDDSLKELQETVREIYGDTHDANKLSEIEGMVILLALLGSKQF